MSELKLEEYVDNGIAFLNEKFPGWYNRIDLEKLAIHKCSVCVVGQICSLREDDEFAYNKFNAIIDKWAGFGSAPQAYRCNTLLRRRREWEVKHGEWEVKHGFWTKNTNYDELTEIWREKIRELRELNTVELKKEEQELSTEYILAK